MPFPSVLSTFNQPTPTSRLNSPSHSALHNTVSSAVGQLEAVIGVEGANSVVGTLEYFIKSPDSNGGGHVQQANVGGTGQTNFTKGDLLIATSSSVLAKLAIGTVGQVLVVDSNQSTGLKYANVVSNKIATTTTSVTVVSSSGLSALFSASILGSTLGTNNAVKFKGVLQTLGLNANDQLTIQVKYGNGVINTLSLSETGSILGTSGTIEGMIMGNAGISSQIGYVKVQTSRTGAVAAISSSNLQPVFGFNQGTSSVESSADQNLVITGQFNGVNGRNSILTGIFEVEKIA